MKKFLITLIVLGSLGVVVYFYWLGAIRLSDFVPNASNVYQGALLEDVQESGLHLVVGGLEIPWEIALLPGGDLLVTERHGRLKRIGEKEAVYEIDGVHHEGEGGLLGLALHPNFQENGQIYLYLTTKAGDSIKNRVDRYQLVEGGLSGRTTVIQNIPGSRYHNGGRIAFGSDDKLFITTGDAEEPFLAQDKNSLAGKILRINDDGSVPSDNPFNSLVWSYGHRNPQGLAWDGQGRLWATEHGRSGIQSGFDELNLIEPGKNYGWPVIEGDETQIDMETSKIQSGALDTWAPSGAIFWRNSIYFGGLRGAAIYQGLLGKKDKVRVIAHFQDQVGRIRAITIDPNDSLYFATSNTDGRGRVREGDDKIYKVDIRSLKTPEELVNQ